MSRSKWTLWTLVGVLVGAGSAWADDEKGTADSTAMPEECEDAGVSLTFGAGSAKLNAKGRSALNDVAKWMEVDKGRKARIDIYPDSLRTSRLSDRRPQAAKDYL